MKLYLSLLIFILLTPPVYAVEVLASIKPIHSLLASLQQGIGTPELLLNDNQSAHTFALKPSQARKIGRADLIVWIGSSMETPLDEIFAKHPDKNIIRLIDLPGLHFPSQEHEQHHHADNRNPHIWLSIDNAIVIAQSMGKTLSKIDPANTSGYQQNTKQLIQRLHKLDEELKQQLSSLQDIPYMVFHNAYSHFEQEYQLHNVGSITENGEYRKGARYIASLRKKITEKQVKCLFEEPQFHSRISKMLVAGSTVQMATLDPLGANIALGSEQYFTLLHQLANSLSDCLGTNHNE